MNFEINSADSVDNVRSVYVILYKAPSFYY